MQRAQQRGGDLAVEEVVGGRPRSRFGGDRVGDAVLIDVGEPGGDGTDHQQQRHRAGREHGGAPVVGGEPVPQRQSGEAFGAEVRARLRQALPGEEVDGDQAQLDGEEHGQRQTEDVDHGPRQVGRPGPGGACGVRRGTVVRSVGDPGSIV